jgi:DNA-binding CsgD family transcriptional regulator
MITEHEFYIYVEEMPSAVFYKVVRGAGGIAASDQTSLPENKSLSLLEQGETGEMEIQFDKKGYRRNALLRYFPELSDVSEEELGRIFSRIPALVKSGLDRMPPNMKVDKHLRVTYSWLTGSSYAEIAEEEGFSDDTKPNISIGSFLNALRKSFTLEEIIAGELSEKGPENPDKVLVEELEKLLKLRKAPNGPSVLEPEEARMIAMALGIILTPKSQTRLEQTLLGKSTRQIAMSEGIPTKVIYQWRENLIEKLGRNTTPEELIKAAKSDNPKEALAKAAVSKKEDAKIGLRRAAILRTFPEWEDLPFEELETIFFEKVPALVEKGPERFNPNANVPRQLKLIQLWLSGKSSYEIAREEDIHSHYVSIVTANFLRSLRREFSLEEITSGRIDPQRAPGKKTSGRRQRKSRAARKKRQFAPKPKPSPEQAVKPKTEEQGPEPERTPEKPEPVRVGNWPSQESKDFWEKVSKENREQGRTIVGPILEVIEELEDY